MVHFAQIGALATSPQLTTLTHISSTHAQWIDWAHMAFVAVGLLCILTVIVWLVPLLIRSIWHAVMWDKSTQTVPEGAQVPQGECSHSYPPQLHIRNRGQLRCVVCELSAVRAKLDRDIASLMATRAILAEILANRLEEDDQGRPGDTEEENE